MEVFWSQNPDEDSLSACSFMAAKTFRKHRTREISVAAESAAGAGRVYAPEVAYRLVRVSA